MILVIINLLTSNSKPNLKCVGGVCVCVCGGGGGLNVCVCVLRVGGGG